MAPAFIAYGVKLMTEKKSSSTNLKILEHELVPKHEVLPIDEGLNVLKQYGVRPEQLPWIKASDPVARAIGAKPGDIVRIIRRTPDGREVVVYRYVVP